jgi:HPt (histidine-containing phosphotransfer) domain-containing protein
MSDTTPVGQMTTGELGGCLEHARWLLQRRQLLPGELFAQLEAWVARMQAELDDRAAQEADSRGH